MVGKETAADRLMQNLDYRLYPNTERLTRAQVAVVMHALADHTAIQAAMTYDPPRDDTYPWPVATSIGRWFHAVADELEYGGSQHE